MTLVNLTKRGKDYVALASIGRKAVRASQTVYNVAKKFGIEVTMLKARASNGKKVTMRCVPKKDVEGLLQHLGTLRRYNNEERRTGKERRQTEMNLDGQHRPETPAETPAATPVEPVATTPALAIVERHPVADWNPLRIPEEADKLIAEAARLLKQAGVESGQYEKGKLTYRFIQTGSIEV